MQRFWNIKFTRISWFLCSKWNFITLFENFRNICQEKNKLHPLKFLSAPGLAWKTPLKNTKVKLNFSSDFDMLLMVEKGIRGRMCRSIYRYEKANNSYMKDYDKNKESSYVQNWDVNNLWGWAMSRKPPVYNFEWIKGNSQFNEDFIKNYNEESNEWYFLETDVQYVENIHELHNDLTLFEVKKLVAKLHDKTNILFI